MSGRALEIVELRLRGKTLSEVQAILGLSESALRKSIGRYHGRLKMAGIRIEEVSWHAQEQRVREFEDPFHVLQGDAPEEITRVFYRDGVPEEHRETIWRGGATKRPPSTQDAGRPPKDPREIPTRRSPLRGQRVTARDILSHLVGFGD